MIMCDLDMLQTAGNKKKRSLTQEDEQEIAGKRRKMEKDHKTG